jgi:hypothetical protein
LITSRAPRHDLLAEARAAFEFGDYARALSLWEPLARTGVARAQNNIGVCFSNGFGVEPDPDLAIRWFSIAAEGGDPLGSAISQRPISTVWALQKMAHALPNSIVLPRSRAMLWPRTC